VISIDNLEETIKSNRKSDSLTQQQKKQIQDILALREDWDSEGAKPYKAQTVNEAIQYLDLMKSVLEEKNIKIGALDFLPGPDESIDLQWKSEEYELLLNVPEQNTLTEDRKPAKYFGCVLGKDKEQEIKGELRLWE